MRPHGLLSGICSPACSVVVGASSYCAATRALPHTERKFGGVRGWANTLSHSGTAWDFSRSSLARYAGRGVRVSAGRLCEATQHRGGASERANVATASSCYRGAAASARFGDTFWRSTAYSTCLVCSKGERRSALNPWKWWGVGRRAYGKIHG